MADKTLDLKVDRVPLKEGVLSAGDFYFHFKPDSSKRNSPSFNIGLITKVNNGEFVYSLRINGREEQFTAPLNKPNDYSILYKTSDNRITIVREEELKRHPGEVCSIY